MNATEVQETVMEIMRARIEFDALVLMALRANGKLYSVEIVAALGLPEGIYKTRSINQVRAALLRLEVDRLIARLPPESPISGIMRQYYEATPDAE